MKFTEEQLAKIKAAKTAEELIALAKAEGIEATEEQIRAQFDAMHKEGELADDELNNVSGAGCDSLDPDPKRAKYMGKIGWASQNAYEAINVSPYFYFTSDDGTYKNVKVMLGRDFTFV